MDDSDGEYLSPTFDPNSVTVPRLRSILVKHDVSYPGHAKKGELVEIFNEKVAPQISKLVKQRARTKPSTKGISNALPVNGRDTEDEVAQTVEDTPRRSSRRAGSAMTDVTNRRASSTKQSSAAPSRGASATTEHGVTSESDLESTASMARSKSRRQTRKSIVTPTIKEEEQDDSGLLPDGSNDESPFTNDNPFQSGSSPLYNAGQEPRRRTSGFTGQAKERKKPPSSRRKTDVVPDTSAKQVNGFATELAQTQPKQGLWLRPQRDSEDFTASDTGEEFTPEEQQELDNEIAHSGQVDVLPPRSRLQSEKSNPARNALLVAPWAILFAMFCGFAAVWRREKIDVGYCGVGRPPTTILQGVEIPEWGRAVLPKCEPCPPHAYCHSTFDVSCEPDFMLKNHPLSLGGLIPLPPTCEPDGDKARKVKAVADRAVSELRSRNAKYECGEAIDGDGQRLTTNEMEESELKNKMSTLRRKGMSQNEFEDLWHSAIGEVVGRDEITTGVDGRHRRTLRSASLALVPFPCALRRSLRLTLARHFGKLVAATFLAALALHARSRLTTSRADNHAAKRLASFALDRLAAQAALHLQSPGRVPEGWIAMGQLRDDVLRDEFSARRRQRLWDRVQKKVEGNSNVRARVAEGRSGDVSRVWEWIGAVDVLDEGGGGGEWEGKGRRASARFFGGVGSAAPEGSSPLVRERAEGNGERAGALRRWEESRPIY